MSYKLKVLKDHPIASYPLTEIYNATIKTYQDVKDNYATYQAFENDFLTYLNVIDTVVYDVSGCGNDGTYVGDIYTDALPLVSGGVFGTTINSSSSIALPINKNYYGISTTQGMGTKYSSDNDFTIECWIYPSIVSTSQTPIMSDSANNIGLYWENGDIVFKASATESIRYPVTYSKRALHLVGVYSVYSISLYVDGRLVANKSLVDGFKFTNTTLSISVGPTASSGDSFIIDGPAIYRHSLSNASIQRHYADGNFSAPAIQVVAPDEGILFSCTDASIRAQFQYSYPVNRNWSEFIDSNTYYNESAGYISFYKTESVQSKTFILQDSFLIPSQIPFVSSKVEWRNDLGITVESSVDGTNWQNCLNGHPLAQYTKDSFSSTGVVHIKITMATTDASKFLPRLAYFAVSFYTNKDVYADNYGDIISSSTEYYLGSLNYPLLSRHYDNGIRTKAGAGFNLTTTGSVKSLEMFLTPSALTANTLLDTVSTGSYAASRYSWTNDGTITKTNILKIYVNGIDKTSQTNISGVFSANQLHHIIIVLTQPASGILKFNYLVSGGPSCLYNNIAIYAKELTSTIAAIHYDLYVGRPAISVQDLAITMTEKGIESYNNDWIVLQSI
jgi:hypothetical protein